MEREGTASRAPLACQGDGEETSTILVVDDEPGIVRMLQAVLERRGFSVLTADSGKVALDLISTRPVDLVVLDIMMPELDGITTCRHLKADPVFRHIPVILLTAKDSLRDKVFGLEMGADDYMTKPFSGEELVARINVQLRIRRMAREVIRRNRELAILNAVAEAVGRSLHQGEVLQAALEKIGEMEEVAAAYILFRDLEAGRVVVVGHNLAGPRGEGLAPIEAKVLQEGLPHCSPDVSQVPDLTPIPVPAEGGSFLLVPLASPGAAAEPARDLVGWTGLLGLFSRPQSRFGEDEVRLFGALGRQLTMALQNTHLFARLERQVGQTQALYHVSASVISSQAVDQVMRAIVERFVEAMQVDRCAITLLAGEGAGHLIVGYDRIKEEPWVQGVELSLDRHPEMRWVLETQQPLIIPDVATEPVLESVRDILLSLQIRSILAIPLLAHEKSIGIVSVSSRGPVRHFTQGEIDFCQTLANQAALAIENARLFAETKRLANTDELTGLYNHRHFYHLCGSEVNRARRYGRPLSLIMLDLDHFKQFNDQYGHLAGDEALRRLAQILRRNSRGVDMVARYGGEEFAIILPETDLEQAAIQADRLRAAVAEYRWPQGRLTVSLGVASLTQEMTKAKELVQAADQALYQAKAGGRNRVSPGTPPSR